MLNLLTSTCKLVRKALEHLNTSFNVRNGVCRLFLGEYFAHLDLVTDFLANLSDDGYNDFLKLFDIIIIIRVDPDLHHSFEERPHTLSNLLQVTF